jgi:hypothetical protein
VQRSGAEGYAIKEGLGPIEWREGKAYCKRIPIPEIPPAIEHAVRLCGGWTRLKDCPEDEYQWLKKEFLSAVENCDRVALAENRMLGPVADLVRQLGASVKNLPGPVEQVESWRRERMDESAEYESTPYGPVEKTQPITILKRVRGAGTEMTDGQWEERKRLLRQQAEDMQRLYGGPHPSTVPVFTPSQTPSPDDIRKWPNPLEGDQLNEVSPKTDDSGTGKEGGAWVR